MEPQGQKLTAMSLPSILLMVEEGIVAIHPFGLLMEL